MDINIDIIIFISYWHNIALTPDMISYSGLNPNSVFAFSIFAWVNI